MNYYIIDGNNLIGKDPKLRSKSANLEDMSREKLAFKLDRYFSDKNCKVSLHFDGFPKEAINTSRLKIRFSENRTADEKIKEQIDDHKNPKLVTVITSDMNLAEFARVNSCRIIKSEDFLRMIRDSEKKDTESERINSINENDIRKIFGV